MATEDRDTFALYIDSFTEARLTSTSRNRSQGVHPYDYTTEWTEAIVHFWAPLCQEV
jgi:hypothetical protein